MLHIRVAPGAKAVSYTHLEMAGDVTLTKLLLGMGLRSFSMHPAQILAVKQEVLRSDTGKLTPWAEQIMADDEPAKRIVKPT